MKIKNGRRLARLIEETDKNKSSRISSLLHERERIDNEIARVESGDIYVLDAGLQLAD